MSKSGRHYSIFQEVFSMNAVGIDVSKGKSTVAILRTMGEIVQTKDIPHDMVSFERLAYQIQALGEDTRVIMEATGPRARCTGVT